MKTLFLHFYDFSPHSGISKKIIAQIGALNECGADTHLCYMKIDEHGNRLRMFGDEVICNYGNSIFASIIKWFHFAPVTRYILNHGIEFVYIRSFYNTNPQILRMLRKLRRAGVTCVMEIPTYPYDLEVKRSSIKHKLIFSINRLFRQRLKKYLRAIVTFSDFKEIHGVKCINISNGIDFASIPLKKENSASFEPRSLIRLTGVAEVRFWHGFDRVITGLANYYASGGDVEVVFDIVGEGDAADILNLKQLVSHYQLDERVRFLGNKSGAELDSIFDNTHFGIASLGRHRSGITSIKTLKNREYAARGIPFIYSETDSDFDNMPYVLKASANESPIDINLILNFLKDFKMNPSQIRATIEGSLSWRVQMQKVIDEVFSKKL